MTVAELKQMAATLRLDIIKMVGVGQKVIWEDHAR